MVGDALTDIHNSYSKGSVDFNGGGIQSGRPYMVGGLAGMLMASTNNSYSETAVSVHNYHASNLITGLDSGGMVGGLAGAWYNIALNGDYDTFPTQVTNAFSVSPLSLSNAGDNVIINGLVGFAPEVGDGGYITNSYYDATRTGQSSCTVGVYGSLPDGTDCYVVNENNSQPDYFKKNHTNAPLDQWDFTSIWRTACDYPDFVGAGCGGTSGGGGDTGGGGASQGSGSGGKKSSPVKAGSKATQKPAGNTAVTAVTEPTPVASTDGRTQTKVPLRLPQSKKARTLASSIAVVIEPISPIMARAITYSLLLLILGLAAYYGYISYREYERRKTIKEEIDRSRKAQLARSAYLESAALSMNSSLMIMRNGVQSMVNRQQIAPEVSSAVSSRLTNLTTHFQRLLSSAKNYSVQHAPVIGQADDTSIPSILTRPIVWLPVAVVTVLMALANYVFVQGDKYTVSPANAVMQLTLLGLCGIALAASVFYKRRLWRELKQAEGELLSERQHFEQQTSSIAAANLELSRDSTELSETVMQVANQPGGHEITDAYQKLTETLDTLEKTPQTILPGQQLTQ